jgi:hypothetical protein
LFVIDVPPKIWRPKPVDRYIPIDYSDDLDESVFLFERYGRALRCPLVPHLNERTDIHLWDSTRDQAEFEKNFVIDPNAAPPIRAAIVDIIQSHWDCFYSEGVRQPILHFEFCIDTGGSPPVCCRKPHYGPHEGKIIMEHLQVLIHNGWIRLCSGPWGSTIVLAAKPHQEHIFDIAEFIWRMCVSYRRLNQITLPFEYPIPRCDDAIDNFGDSAGRLFFISLDNKTGYHQISVRSQDQEKLAFFSPDHKKYTFTVMPFGPRNAPAFYTAMMRVFEDEWNALFEFRHPNDPSHRGSRTIIDDILLWSTVLTTLLNYFKCVCAVFLKYRVTFQLKKCEFLTNRIEYVGHDITPDGNCPAQSKFALITDWPLPVSGQALGSFIGLLTFYNCYCPWFEIRVKPLRRLERQYHRKPIPVPDWTAPLIALWDELKLAITSSPCLARYDSSKPCFLKTDWSALGMGWILMQPDDFPASVQALHRLHTDGICDFDITMTGARLRPVRFGSRKCTDREHHFHSFVGEAACGRWAISQNRKFLWGTEFFWLCDCSAVREILEYDGPIHQIRRWAQELLGYHFQIFHRPARLMRDVDGLTRRYDHPLTVTHLQHAIQLSTEDAAARPAAYDPVVFATHNPLKCPTHLPATGSSASSDPEPVLSLTSRATMSNLPLRFQPDPSPSSFNSSSPATGSHLLLSHRTLAWISVTPQFGAVLAALHSHSDLFPLASLVIQPSAYPATPVCHAVLPQSSFVSSTLSQCLATVSLLWTPTTCDYSHLDPILTHFLQSNPRITGIDLSCPHVGITGQLLWLQSAFSLITLLRQHYHITSFLLFIHLPTDLDCGTLFSDFAHRWCVSPWQLQTGPTTSALYDDAVHARRWICTGLHQIGMYPDPAPSFPAPSCHPSSLGNHIISSYNLVDAHCLPIPTPAGPLATTSSQPCTAPHPLAVLQSITTPLSPHTFSVLDPDFPASEPDPSASASLSQFAGTFGIPFTSCLGTTYVRAFALPELLSCYSVPSAAIPAIPLTVPIASLAPSFATCCPFQLGRHFVDHLIDIHLFAHLDTTQSPTGFVARCLTSSASRPIPTSLDWTAAYNQDPDCTLLLQRLTAGAPFSRADILSLHSAYRDYVRQDRLSLVDRKLVVFQPVQNNTEMIMLIIVPASLRRDIFSAYHATPATGHMGIYKTLHRIRLRFFWPHNRKDITDWVLQCPHCLASNGAVSRNSELVFSWPLCCPFYILHVDLWAPGDIANYRGETYLLNAMCDLTGFVLVSATSNITAHDLARLFVQNVLLKIGFCGVVVVDDGSTFKGLFKAVCLLLNISFHVAAKGNHKAVSVEHFHRFLNKAVTIAANDRGTNTVFVEAAHTAAYAWNSSPIDGTDIIRSVPAVGRPFRFPFDISLRATPTPTSNQAADVHAFLRLAAPTAQFAEQVLRLLTEDRRAAHRERINATRSPVTFVVGDLVMALVQVQSDATTGTVAKLSYRRRGPYEVVEVTGHGTYLVRRHGHPASPAIRYATQALRALPPALLPCTPIDTPDFRYLNHSHSPLPHPLRSPFNIQMYNNVWFSTPLSTDHPPLFQFTDTPAPDMDPLPFPLPAASLPAAAAVPLSSNDDPLIPSTPTTGPALLAAIHASSDRLFFVSYRASGTLRPCWYLVQVDLPMSSVDRNSAAFASHGRYYCHFLGRHPDDISLPDPVCRWWPLWHRFTRAADGTLEYHNRILFTPTTLPDATLYVAWADVLPLLDPNICLFGPFSFSDPAANPPGRTPSFRQSLVAPLWASLTTSCHLRGISPPILACAPSVRSRWTRSSRPRATPPDLP